MKDWSVEVVCIDCLGKSAEQGEHCAGCDGQGVIRV